MARTSTRSAAARSTTPGAPRRSAAAAKARSVSKPPRDVAQEITDQIIALLEQGDPLPWRRPWRTAGAGLPLRFNGDAYRGVNVFMLGLKAMAAGYASPYWMTFKQALELGAAVRKGERATTVVYYGVAGRRDGEDGAGDGTGDRAGDRAAGDRAGDVGGGGDGAARGAPRRFLKWYAAFNAEQIEGLSARYHPERGADLDGGARPVAPLAQMADAMIAGLGVDYREGGDRACYIRGVDRIEMPDVSRFECYRRYLATRFHECAHAAEHPKRLGIDYGPKVFGNEAYAKGELYAELASVIVGATLGFAPDHIEDHAAYVQSWLAALRGDKRFILKASADAQRGADYLIAAMERGMAARAA